MPRGTEESLTETLWDWLSEEGYSVSGEVHIGNGQIDLVAKKNGQYAGFEVKTIYNLWANSSLSYTNIKEALEQVDRYRRSNYLDEIYLCCEEIERVSNKIEIVRRQTSHLSSLIDRLGLIELSLDSDVETRMVRSASLLDRSREPMLSRTNESWVQHHVWKWAQKSDWYVSREGLLPRDSYVDICVRDGSSSTNKILQNQEQYSHIGIEVKGTNAEQLGEISQQLQDYIESGGLTHLYLAIPRENKDKVVPNFGQQRTTSASPDPVPSTVGIITVDKSGKVEKIQEAEKVKMEYDGIRRDDQKYVPVGLGYQDEASKDDFDSISYWYYHNRSL